MIVQILKQLENVTLLCTYQLVLVETFSFVLPDFVVIQFALQWQTNNTAVEVVINLMQMMLFVLDHSEFKKDYKLFKALTNI